MIGVRTRATGRVHVLTGLRRLTERPAPSTGRLSRFPPGYIVLPHQPCRIVATIKEHQ